MGNTSGEAHEQVGHSKAGSVVLLYGAQYNDVRCVFPTTAVNGLRSRWWCRRLTGQLRVCGWGSCIVNVAGRFHMAVGIEERLGAEGMAALAADGVWLQKDRLVRLFLPPSCTDARACISLMHDVVAA